MATEYTETLDTILKDTIPQLPGAVRSVAERELRLSMREFFERSYAWRSTLTVDAPAGDVEVWLQDANDLDENSDVIGILQVKFNADPTAVNSSCRVVCPAAAKPGCGTAASQSPLAYYMTSNSDAFKLYPGLSTAVTDGLEVTVALTPKLDAVSFPRQITTKFYDAIVDGFLGRMYAHPNKPYSAPAVAMMMKQSFKRHIGYYMAQAKQGNANAQNWRYPSGWS